MPNKTFQFDAISKKFVVKCNMPEKEYDAGCPVVRVYRAGIDTKVITPANEPDKIAVRLAEAASVETVNIMFDIGKCMCTNCRFNAEKGKVH